jgi:hypothetical protein
MATGKKYYWLKLKESFLMGDEIDFLMSQKNGSDYAMMYLMLCMKTINTDGKLLRRIGEVLMPIDVDKLQRDLKYFSQETIIIAIELYKRFGLIYEETDGVLTISNYEDIVGYETDFASQKRKQRSTLKNGMDIGVDTTMDNVHTLPLKPTQTMDNVHTNVHTEIEIDKDIDKEYIEGKGKPKRKRFEPPTLDMLNEYAQEKGYVGFSAERFFNYYESNGWKVGKNPMKSWKAAVSNWAARDDTPVQKAPQSQTPNRFHNFDQRMDDLDALLKNGRVFRGKNV